MSTCGHLKDLQTGLIKSWVYNCGVSDKIITQVTWRQLLCTEFSYIYVCDDLPQRKLEAVKYFEHLNILPHGPQWHGNGHALFDKSNPLLYMYCGTRKAMQFEVEVEIYPWLYSNVHVTEVNHFNSTQSVLLENSALHNLNHVTSWDRVEGNKVWKSRCGGQSEQLAHSRWSTPTFVRSYCLLHNVMFPHQPCDVRACSGHHKSAFVTTSKTMTILTKLVSNAFCSNLISLQG